MSSVFEEARPDDYLTRLARSDLGRSAKALALAELQMADGATVLDLGCGPGDDLVTFAPAVGSAGSVIGVDLDDDHVQQARTRTAGFPQVQVQHGDIQRLDLPDGSADSVHTDRVLQHVADPAAVLTETKRVLKAGGRAVFAEPDWDTLVIDYPDPSVARAYTRFITDRVVRNAVVGRQLPGLATAAGFTVERVIPVTSVFLQCEAADKVLGLKRVTERAVAAGYLSAAAGGAWLEHLATQPFFASATLFITVACAHARPDPGSPLHPSVAEALDDLGAGQLRQQGARQDELGAP